MKFDGSLNAAWAASSWGQQAQLFAQDEADLTEVVRLDSAALALLVKWSQACQARGSRLRILGADDNFIKLASLYGVAELFELAPLH
ncbi:STAS domain-containing protein [Pseudaeromonas paramecii]|uniref:STAS domain-containing protein n=1 Tax=Pseudaeromonas paramecii TaxID=2138166 RepID=A0ABP8Q6S4_9GAMM